MADKVSRHTIAGGDAPALLTLIGAARRRAEASLGGTVRVVTCYEAGYDGFWLHRLLVAHGIANQVIDPASLLVNRRARRRKTDRIDLAGLLRTLMAWHRGEPQVCSMVRVPSPEEEDQRRRGRERERLVKERVQHLGRVKGLLMTQGVRDFQPARRGWRERLEAFRTGDPCRTASGRRSRASAGDWRWSTRCWTSSSGSATPRATARHRGRRPCPPSCA